LVENFGHCGLQTKQELLHGQVHLRSLSLLFGRYEPALPKNLG
jgi:hypothetical protein